MISTEKGSTKNIVVSFYNVNDVLTDPDTGSAKIAIYFKDGTVILTATALTSTGVTGIYQYYWSIATDALVGTYILEVTATFAGATKYHTNRDTVYISDIICGD